MAAVVTNEGASEGAIRLIADVLNREALEGNLTVDNSTLAAQQFLHMVIAVPQLRAMGLGMPMSSAEVDAWARNVVNLFLNGCRGWKRTATRRRLLLYRPTSHRHGHLTFAFHKICKSVSNMVSFDVIQHTSAPSWLFRSTGQISAA